MCKTNNETKRSEKLKPKNKIMNNANKHVFECLKILKIKIPIQFTWNFVIFMAVTSDYLLSTLLRKLKPLLAMNLTLHSIEPKYTC